MLYTIKKQVNTLFTKHIEKKDPTLINQRIYSLFQRAFSRENDTGSASSLKMMTQEEFVKWRIGSKQDYIARMQKAFPDVSPQSLEESYATRCRLGYRDYKNAFNTDFNDPGVMFRAEDFIDEPSKKEE